MNDFETTGRLWLRGLLDGKSLGLLDGLGRCDKPGARLELAVELSHVFGSEGAVARALHKVLPDSRAVRMVVFNKTEASNWGVPWHQDRIIAIANRVEMCGFGNWTIKDGVTHCEPPVEILSKMAFLRLHLDDETENSGPMQIALGSHQAGPVSASAAAEVAARFPIETCIGKRGDVLVLKMLTLHRSKPATEPSTRRVLRVDFANAALPSPLEWAALR